MYLGDEYGDMEGKERGDVLLAHFDEAVLSGV
jgi:hypothetical protein